jgi:hypothetical protein
MIRLKSLICEVYSSEARFGLGAVASNGAVDFKEYSRDLFGSQIHGKGGTPYGRNTFRYADGIIDWSDGHPDKEVKHAIETYLQRKGFPFKKHTSYYDKFGPSDDNVDENYNDSLSDDEKTDLANLYFSVGQDDDETIHKNYCWIWSKSAGSIKAKKGGTHSINFGQTAKEYTYSGWYDVDKNMISIVFPEHEARKLGNKRPTEDDIPQQIYQALIRTFGKRKPTFMVFETVERLQLKRLIMEVASILFEGRLRGEWWFEDGQAVYADGDTGDINHEGRVIDALRREILDALGVDAGNHDYAPDFNDVKDEIIQNIGDELNAEELEAWKNDEFAEVVISYLKRKGDSKIDNKIYYIRGHDSKGKTLDAREYALVNWGWQRVKGNVIQTQTLTSKDLNSIVSGLWDAYNDELENRDEGRVSNENPQGEQTFDIEVMSTRSWYQGVPWSVLEKKNPTSLNPYRTRYE